MKLTIITINFNNAEGLKKTIESIICQSYTDFEYIIIDGGSTDGSVDVIKKHSNRVSYWVSEPDSGIYNAMNKGIKQAKGEYLLFVNSGDTINDISPIVDHLHKHDLIYFNLEIILNSDNRYIKEYPKNLDIKYFLEDTLPHTATFIKRSLLLDNGLYSENMKICSDWAFFFKFVCLKGASYKKIDACFSSFYADGISSMPENMNLIWKEREEFIRSEFPLLLTLYKDWEKDKVQINKLKSSRSISLIKKMGLLKWF